MKALKLRVTNETNRLKTVVLGLAKDNGPAPSLEETYDPKSRKHLKEGTYPKNADMIREMEAFRKVLEKYGVETLRPQAIESYNQIFSRDIAFVIGDKLVRANILPEREQEFKALDNILKRIAPENLLSPPEEVHVEGGDVMLEDGHIFVGTYRGSDYSDLITARTNPKAVEWLERTFPERKVVSFNLKKSNTDPYKNALHLDCCFQPVGKDAAILHRGGFLEEEEYLYLKSHYGAENCFEIDSKEMYSMYSNVFSIAQDVVVSDESFDRLNDWLEGRGITVERISYSEIAKQEGLLRCSTLPLIRE